MLCVGYPVKLIVDDMDRISQISSQWAERSESILCAHQEGRNHVRTKKEGIIVVFSAFIFSYSSSQPFCTKSRFQGLKVYVLYTIIIWCGLVEQLFVSDFIMSVPSTSVQLEASGLSVPPENGTWFAYDCLQWPCGRAIQATSSRNPRIIHAITIHYVVIAKAKESFQEKSLHYTAYIS